MKQYLDLLRKVSKEGVNKSPSREGMPETLSIFGYQYRHDLADGFPLLTTKQLDIEKIAVELMWFIKGESNIKYLVDQGCNIWNEDAYMYYKKIVKNHIANNNIPYNIMFCEDDGDFREYTLEEFLDLIKNSKSLQEIRYFQDYRLGDCGEQYGKLWRDWKGEDLFETKDQFRDLIHGLMKNPLSRRHIISAWNPSTLEEMALPACHTIMQFNCRPLSYEEKVEWVMKEGDVVLENAYIAERVEQDDVPKFFLDCQLYQRSADVFLGVPYNIASYALLIHIISKICNFVPGEFIHSFGDVHMYDNHANAVEEQLLREPESLPKLIIAPRLKKYFQEFRECKDDKDLDYCIYKLISSMNPSDFGIDEYYPQKRIKAKLSTGLK